MIAQDPDFALAHAFKARGYELARRPYRPINGLAPDEMARVALEHTEMALALNPNLGLAHMVLAEIHYGQLRRAEAKQAYEHALQLSPNDVTILSTYARFLSFFGEHDEAIQLGSRVLELAPYDANNHYLHGWTLMYAGNAAAAAEQFRLGNAIVPNFYRYINLSLAEIHLGHKTLALEALRSADQLMDETITTRDIARVGNAYSKLGLQEDAKRLFDLIQSSIANGKLINTSYLALAYFTIGDVEKAKSMLNHDPYDAYTILHYIKFGIVDGVIK